MAQRLPAVSRELMNVLRRRGFPRPPKWYGTSEVFRVAPDVTAQAWSAAHDGGIWYATSDGTYFLAVRDETAAQAYEALQRSQTACACLSYTDLADLDDDEAGQTHVTSDDYTNQESR